MSEKGFVVKAVYEDSHPPVWRRIFIPDRISFADFSEILKVSFALPEEQMEYSFPYENTHVVYEKNIRSGNFERGLLPAYKTPFAEFLADYNWTRCKLQDGRRIRITLEKHVTSKLDRQAVLIKAKDKEINKNWFSDVNEKLGKLKLPVRELTYNGGGDSLKQKKVFRSIADSLQILTRIKDGTADAADIERLAKIKKEMGIHKEEPAGISIVSDAEDETGAELRKQTDAAVKFLENLEQGEFDAEYIDHRNEESIVGTAQDADGQLLLPVFTEDEIKRIDAKKKKTVRDRPRICIGQSDHKQADLLKLLATNHVRNYLRFMALPNEGSRSELLRYFFEVMQKNPEMICYLFSYEGGQEVRRICRQESDIIKLDPVYIREIVGLLQSLALAECSVTGNKSGQTLTILYAKDLPQLLDSIDEKKWRSMDLAIQDKGDKLLRLVSLYGVIDAEDLYRIYDEIYGREDHKELQRITYWHLRMLDFLVTMTDKTNAVHTVAMPGIDVQYAMNYQMMELSPKLSYRYVSKKEWEILQKGINLFYSCWDDMLEHLHQYCSEDKINRLALELFEALNDGYDMNYCLGIMEKYHKPRHNPERVFNWYLLMEVFMETRIRSLKWNSREEYCHIVGEYAANAHCLPVITESIAALEEKDQICLYHLWRDAEYSTISSIFSRDHIENGISNLLEKYCGNYDLAIAAVFVFCTMGKSSGEITRLFSGKDDFSRDEKENLKTMISRAKEVHEAFYDKARRNYHYRERYIVARDGIDKVQADGEGLLPPGIWTYTDEDMKGNSSPVQRPVSRGKKIMPNEPCPCGSGKKYKKCCGRN